MSEVRPRREWPRDEPEGFVVTGGEGGLKLRGEREEGSKSAYKPIFKRHRSVLRVGEEGKYICASGKNVNNQK